VTGFQLAVKSVDFGNNNWEKVLLIMLVIRQLKLSFFRIYFPDSGKKLVFIAG